MIFRFWRVITHIARPLAKSILHAYSNALRYSRNRAVASCWMSAANGMAHVVNYTTLEIVYRLGGIDIAQNSGIVAINLTRLGNLQAEDVHKLG